MGRKIIKTCSLCVVTMFLFLAIAIAHEANRFRRIGLSNRYWDNKTEEVVTPCSSSQGPGDCANCHTSTPPEEVTVRFSHVTHIFYWDNENNKMVKACRHHKAAKNCLTCHTGWVNISKTKK
jgi:hypothetical protein